MTRVDLLKILEDHGVPIDEDAGIQQLRSIVKGVVGDVDGSQRKEYEKEVGREVESKLNSGCESKSEDDALCIVPQALFGSDYLNIGFNFTGL
ncbi:hypothetical protein ACLKA6_017754 [Drosophila palustris]